MLLAAVSVLQLAVCAAQPTTTIHTIPGAQQTALIDCVCLACSSPLRFMYEQRTYIPTNSYLNNNKQLF